MIVIKSGRHPFEVMILAWCLVSGVNSIINYQQAASTVFGQFPDLFGYILYGGTVAGSTVTLVGTFWPSLAGPLIERAGLVMLAGLWVLFGGLLTTVGERGLYWGGFLWGFAAAAIWRSVQIGREMKRVQAAATLIGSTRQVEDG